MTFSSALGRDHPRVCGEKFDMLPLEIRQKGSPPRMRGKVHKEVGNKLRLGITPACAGKRAQRPLPAQTCGDHPRMCGEKIRSFTCGSACRSGRIMPGISSISVSSAHDGHQPKAVGLAASHALTQQCPELL